MSVCVNVLIHAVFCKMGWTAKHEVFMQLNELWWQCLYMHCMFQKKWK